MCKNICEEYFTYIKFCDENLKYYENNLKNTKKEKNFSKKYLKAYIRFQELFSDNLNIDNTKKFLYGIVASSRYHPSNSGGSYSSCSYEISKSKYFRKKDDYLKIKQNKFGIK